METDDGSGCARDVAVAGRPLTRGVGLRATREGEKEPYIGRVPYRLLSRGSLYPGRNHTLKWSSLQPRSSADARSASDSSYGEALTYFLCFGTEFAAALNGLPYRRID